MTRGREDSCTLHARYASKRTKKLYGSLKVALTFPLSGKNGFLRGRKELLVALVMPPRHTTGRCYQVKTRTDFLCVDGNEDEEFELVLLGAKTTIVS